MTSTTPRFNNDLERRSYEAGMKLVAKKLAAGKNQAQHRLTATRLGTTPEVVASVVRSAAAEAVANAKRLAAQRKAAKLATPSPRTAQPTPPRRLLTLHRFCTNTSLFG